MKPFSQACENNKQPILTVISRYFGENQHILEIGTGTGQHAVFFAKHLPNTIWQTSDREQNHPGIKAWLQEARASNIQPPLALDVDNYTAWEATAYDGAFSANTAHIMSWPSVLNMLSGIGMCLKQSGHFCLYGPFKYDGQFTSDSNAHFDNALREQEPTMGIRDSETVIRAAAQQKLLLVDDVDMPANNRLLIFQKSH